MDSSRLPNINNIPLVTSSNPARSDGTFDYERCTTLHNFLVKYGWVGAGNLLRDLTHASFFEKHGDDAEELRDRLQPQVTSFLTSIIIPEETFFIWVEGVSEPSEMLQAEQLIPGETDISPDRYLVLYSTNPGLGEHGVGVIYDQARNLAVLVLGIEDAEYVFPAETHTELWQPLETILSNWIEMIRIGKVTTRKPVGHSGPAESDEEGSDTEGSGEDTESKDGDSESEDEDEVSASDDFDPNTNREYEPWVWHSYSDSQVDSTVSAFDRLVAAIEDRLPQRPATTEETHLLSESDLDAASVPKACFIRAFLAQARRPRFRNIAPGLLVPTRETFAADQKFTPRLEAVLEAGEPDRDGTLVPPVLIFATAYGRRADLDSLGDELSNPFVKHLALEDGDSGFPAGLYSESVERTDIDGAEEGFRLILPFSLGQHARKSDGSLIEEGSIAGLFQHGYKPFGGEWWRAQRLERLFVRWRELVETGVWPVGSDGVAGSIDTFRDADTASGWANYWIHPDW
ncbi:hypothetical protein VMCG_09974 [Cytospora schulzeri]|uniref:Uncharacterized protein n=1 Tax=Cytospora schulzeri TaxID=448051 RepID=A0A423VJ00_9PEZI|nr:hypothetical protein VMCG_09974 [Valsa malicola]